MRRILLADPDPVSRDYLLCLLEIFGPCRAESGAQAALDAFAAAMAQGEPFSVVLVSRDLDLDGGLPLARALDETRRRDGPGRERPRLLLVVDPAETRRQTGLMESLGVDAVLEKPVTRRQIMDTLSLLGVAG